ncbi:UvrD-helicase domain-containing protein [Halobaculum litoreum]|uniref:UvrD-helicase domain-containing protein n=1 Tax=Halobaculum litoreum TaxID=3031998 RepID=A0ABD5XW83_9EURY
MSHAGGDHRPPTDRDELNDEQARLVDAALSADAGLFVQASVPGSGKTYAASRLCAGHAIERAAAGDPRPLAGLVVAAFNREAANDLVPEIVEWIRWVVATDATTAAASLDEADAEALVTAVRRSGTIGTIDALLQRVFDDVAVELGFDPAVTVADDHVASRLHASAFETVGDDPEVADAVARLDAAYPGDDGGPSELATVLENLHKAARDRRWGADEVGKRLRAGRRACYPDGPAESLADVERDLRRFDDATAGLSAEDLHCEEESLCAADRRLYREWGARIGDLVRVYRSYAAAYDRHSRETDTVTHDDRAYWVARYFDDPECAHRHGDADHALVAARRERLRRRWRSRVDLLVVDEAQDVSAGQHAALAPLVGADTRVVLYGDPFQSIYTWRNASPTLFGEAVADGSYLGREWDTHEVVTATTTYRQRPALTRTVNATFGPALTDERRGVAPTVESDYEHLDPDRSTADPPALHVPTFDPRGTAPKAAEWHANEGDSGCADALADYVRGAVAGGQFGDPDDATPVQVLFRSRTYMDLARATFEGQGLSVGAERDVFAAPYVRAAVALLRWLVDPTDPSRTEHLLTASAFAPERDSATARGTLADTVSEYDWDLVAAATAPDEPNDLLAAVADLADDRAERRRCSAGELARRVCRLLDPHHDPLDVQPDATPSLRCRLRDELVDVAASLDAPNVPLRSVVAGLRSMADDPGDARRLDAESDAHDVVFRTVHDAKGDEAPVVALADHGRDTRAVGLHKQTVIAHGDTLAVRPPALGDPGSAATHSLGAYDGGLIGSSESPRNTRTNGLRWATGRLRADDATGTTFAGPPEFAAVAAAKRAEEWRLGYVAATRARDHLVVPVDGTADRDPTRSWAHALAAALDVDALAERETTSVDVDGGPVAVAVDDLPGLGPVADHPPWESSTAAPHGTQPRSLRAADERVWLPRFLNPSTFRPLADDHDRHVLDHLRHGQVDTGTRRIDPDLPLPFETVAPGRVGRIAHDAVASVVRKGLWAGALRDGSPAVDDSVAWACRRYEREFEPIPAAERERIVSYVTSTVMPQFADAGVFRRVARADAVHVEEPVETVVRVDGVDLEVRGQADFVLRTGDEWSIEERRSRSIAGVSGPTSATTPSWQRIGGCSHDRRASTRRPSARG